MSKKVRALTKKQMEIVIEAVTLNPFIISTKMPL